MRVEKEALLTQLRESLEASGRKAQMEAQAQEVQNLQDTLKGVPLQIYVY